MRLVIVESPTKAKTIGKFLGKEFHVVASMGHVRDLPQSSDEVPAAFKKTPAGQLGVDVEHDFQPIYVIPKDKSKTIAQLKKLAKEADEIYLATDEDREGESISWHLLQILKPTVPVKRMVFHEITRSAIDEALAHPRDIDEKLVRAQETRRILDRLVGYTVSPVLWKKIAYGLSAGRVQSVALKAAVDRERARMAFRKAEYWDVAATVGTGDKKQETRFEATLIETDGKRVAIGKDFDETSGALKQNADVLAVDEPRARSIAEQVKAAPWKVTDVNEKPITRRPPAPFITSTLQQEANRKLGLSSKETMRTAQALYEKGHITYMRTDSTVLAADAVRAAREKIASRFGKEYLTEAPRVYVSQSKGAQEAHEAIRPSLNFSTPDETGLSGAERDLYELVWMRTLASQMPDSRQTQMTVKLAAANHIFSALGMKILFPGFLRAYVEGAEDTEQALEDKERLLPALEKGDAPLCESASAERHETKPPARFTEAGLIQYMEKEGIGRPSTYASIITTLLDRGYVRKMSGALVPSFTGFAVTQLLERHFADLVNAGFTSKMEEALDDIAEGTEDWLPYLKTFYAGENGLERRVSEQTERIDPEAAKRIDIPGLEPIVIRVGKFGPYIETELPKTGATVKASLPPDAAPADFTKASAEALITEAERGPTTLGEDPESGKQILLKTGTYGPYLQLGEDEDGEGKTKAKPKRASVPKTVPLQTLDHEKALAILSLPRLLGTHPQTGKDVRAGLGRFGPYVVCDGEFRSLKAEDDVLTVDLARALELLALPKGTRGRAAALKTIGNAKDGKPVTLHKGKYGPYVKHGSLNATVPKGTDPDELTLAAALELLRERAAKKKPSTQKKKA